MTTTAITAPADLLPLHRTLIEQADAVTDSTVRNAYTDAAAVINRLHAHWLAVDPDGQHRESCEIATRIVDIADTMAGLATSEEIGARTDIFSQARLAEAWLDQFRMLFRRSI